MAANVTPVVLEVKDFEPREVMMVYYKFDQATDREGQISGIPRGGKVIQDRLRTQRRGAGHHAHLRLQLPLPLLL